MAKNPGNLQATGNLQSAFSTNGGFQTDGLRTLQTYSPKGVGLLYRAETVLVSLRNTAIELSKVENRILGYPILDPQPPEEAQSVVAVLGELESISSQLLNSVISLQEKI